MVNKIKNLGQINTPIHIVCDMLNLIGYSGRNILRKHILDNSCGSGAFLTEIVKRYIDAYINEFGTVDKIEIDLQAYIHGIEIDKSEYQKCVDNLNNLVFWHGIANVEWDIINADAFFEKKCDHKMDFVIANPPYVRIHNLQENFLQVKEYKFAQNGMTDLFLAFYDIGFKQLNVNGKLCYITPNSFYTSNAGEEFRRFIYNKRNLFSLIDLGHYQPFKATVYTTVCAFDLSKTFDKFDYSSYNKKGEITFQEVLNIDDVFYDGKILLAKKQEQETFKQIQNYKASDISKVQVKNAFATLSDTVFIKDSFDFDCKEIIPVLKASTGEWKKCLFPYIKSKIVNFDKLEASVQKYLMHNKNRLLARDLDKNAQWYAFGRSQAINDVFKNKIAINTTIKNIDSIKLNKVKKGCGVYSGLYILTDEPFVRIEKTIKSDDFINYVKMIGKCKNGGYYTFSSKELKQFLLYKLQV